MNSHLFNAETKKLSKFPKAHAGNLGVVGGRTWTCWRMNAPCPIFLKSTIYKKICIGGGEKYMYLYVKQLTRLFESFRLSNSRLFSLGSR